MCYIQNSTIHQKSHIFPCEDNIADQRIMEEFLRYYNSQQMNLAKNFALEGNEVTIFTKKLNSQSSKTISFKNGGFVYPKIGTSIKCFYANIASGMPLKASL